MNYRLTNERIVLNGDQGKEGAKYYGKEMIARHKARYRWALRHIRKADWVLDVSCGTGYGTKMIAGKAQKVWGLDKSLAAIEYAVQNNEDAKIIYGLIDINRQNVRKVVGGIEKVVSIETIEHLNDPGRFLKNLSQVIVPSGKLILTTILKGKFGKNRYHKHELGVTELRGLIKSNGFRDIKIKLPKSGLLKNNILVTARVA